MGLSCTVSKIQRNIDLKLGIFFTDPPLNAPAEGVRPGVVLGNTGCVQEIRMTGPPGGEKA